MNYIRHAAFQIETALEHLKRAKSNLLLARSDQHVPLAVQITKLEEIYEILLDSECTPEIAEPVEDDDDPR
jgi:hypothetical protein